MVARSHPRGRAAGAFGDLSSCCKSHVEFGESSPLRNSRTFRRSRQSMSSSVANSVRREAQAVIAAISSACTASAR